MTGSIEHVETVIIGAGHAGLTMSYFLRQLGREHVILERARVGERWRSERWDSFHFQFPNWSIEAPGYKYQCEDPDAFAPGHELVRFIQDYATYIKAPTRCGVEVASLEPLDDSCRYLLTTNAGAIEAANVVIAMGPYQRAAIPAMSSDVPRNIFQIHSNVYRNPNQLPAGAPWLWAVELRAARSRTIYTRPVVRFTFQLAVTTVLREDTVAKTLPIGGAALKTARTDR